MSFDPDAFMDELWERLRRFRAEHPLLEFGPPPDRLHFYAHPNYVAKIMEAAERTVIGMQDTYPQESGVLLRGGLGDYKIDVPAWPRSTRMGENELVYSPRPKSVLEPRRVYPQGQPQGHLPLIYKRVPYSWDVTAEEKTPPPFVRVVHEPRRNFGDKPLKYPQPIVTDEPYRTAARTALLTNPEIRSANL
jgi:hypothetical protein